MASSDCVKPVTGSEKMTTTTNASFWTVDGTLIRTLGGVESFTDTVCTVDARLPRFELFCATFAGT